MLTVIFNRYDELNSYKKATLEHRDECGFNAVRSDKIAIKKTVIPEKDISFR